MAHLKKRNIIYKLIDKLFIILTKQKKAKKTKNVNQQ